MEPRAGVQATQYAAEHVAEKLYKDDFATPFHGGPSRARKQVLQSSRTTAGRWW